MDKTFYTEENPIRFPYAAKYEGEEKPYSGFCKLTLNDGTVVELEGEGQIVRTMVQDYLSSVVEVELGSKCTGIGAAGCFASSNTLTSISIPDSIVTFGSAILTSSNNLKTIKISNKQLLEKPNSYSVFSMLSVDYNCENIECIIGNNIVDIRDGAFYGCSKLVSITIPNSVTNIGSNAFAGCSGLNDITIPNSVTNIEYSAFSSCNGLSRIDIPSSVTHVGNYAVTLCGNLKIVNYNASCQVPENFAQGCSNLLTIIIGNNTPSIGNNAFNNLSNLSNVVIGNNVKYIGTAAFSNNGKLESIIIPASVDTIDDGAFANDIKLSSITSLSKTAPHIENYTFRAVGGGGTLTIPSNSSGYDVWMGTGDYYLGKYSWTKVEQ